MQQVPVLLEGLDAEVAVVKQTGFSHLPIDKV